VERPVEEKLGLQGGVVTCASDRAAVGGTAEVKATGRGTGAVGRSISTEASGF
jgi:hypothetical protein